MHKSDKDQHRLSGFKRALRPFSAETTRNDSDAYFGLNDSYHSACFVSGGGIDGNHFCHSDCILVGGGGLMGIISVIPIAFWLGGGGIDGNHFCHSDCILVGGGGN